MSKKFDLNVERVLENWEVSDAIREVIANSLDEQILTNTKEIEIFKDKIGWHVRDFGRGINYKHLTQNENEEKLSNPEKVIGKFGVGLKDALATFNRHKVKVKMISKDGIISIQKSEKHGFEDILTLHAIIDDTDDKNFVGTEVTLEGCSDTDIKDAKKNFLKFSNEKLLAKTEFGEIYSKSQKDSIIYITGLKVSTEENFLFSYNVTSMTKKLRKSLNRERSNVGRTAYTPRIKDILLSCKDEKVAELIAKDFQKYELGESHDELNWLDVSVHACKLISQSKKVIFVTSLELDVNKHNIDDAKSDGYEVITIPQNVQEKIEGIKDYAGNNIRTVEEYIDEFNESFEFKFVEEKNLSSSEKEVFQTKDKIFELIGGQPRNVKKVLISETMRKEFGDSDAGGLWQPFENAIVIKRSELRNLKLFVGTLLHEIGHAISGQPDVSRDFELELTRLLGLVGSKSL